MNKSWSQKTGFNEAHRRAGGRRRYNNVRHKQLLKRRERIAQLLFEHGGYKYGIQTKIAQQIGVSEATISRDFKAMLGKVCFSKKTAAQLEILYRKAAMGQRPILKFDELMETTTYD